MVKNLFINGCSFLEIYDEQLCKTTAGHHLAKKLNLNPIGYAAAARGNDRIITTTKLFFYDNPELIKDTFVLIGWTGVIRNDYLKSSALLSHSPKEGFKPNDPSHAGIKAGDWGTSRWDYPWRGPADSEGERKTRMKKWLALLNNDEEYEIYKVNNYDIQKTMRLRYLEQVLSLQDFFKLNGINYCMYDALPSKFDTAHAKGLDRLADKVDKQRFFQFDGESHMDYVKKEMLTLSETDEHPNYKGHKLWGDRLHAFIKENDLL